MLHKPVGNKMSGGKKEMFRQSVVTKSDVSSPQNALWTQWISTVGGEAGRAGQIRIIVFLGSWKITVCLQHLYYCNFNPVPKSHWKSEWNLKAVREEKEEWTGPKMLQASVWSFSAISPPCFWPMSLQASSLFVPFGENSLPFCSWL